VPLAELMTYVARGKTACRDFHQSTAVITTTSFIISLIKFKTLLLIKAFIRSFPQRQQAHCALYFQRKRVKYRSGITA
jgi:hypothetical protein